MRQKNWGEALPCFICQVRVCVALNGNSAKRCFCRDVLNVRLGQNVPSYSEDVEQLELLCIRNWNSCALSCLINRYNHLGQPFSSIYISVPYGPKLYSCIHMQQTYIHKRHLLECSKSKWPWMHNQIVVYSYNVTYSHNE